MSDLESLTQQIRDALLHLHDFAYLRRHPLMHVLVRESPEAGMARVHELRRCLVQGIESLKPAEDVPLRDKRWRPYLVLRYSFVDSLDPLQIEKRLALGERQVQREKRRGLEALAALLWEQRVVTPEQEPLTPQVKAVEESGATSSGHALLSQEVQRIGVERVPTSIRRLLDNACRSVNGLAAERGVTLECRNPEPDCVILVDPVLLRQALVAALSHVIESAGVVSLRIGAGVEDGLFRLAIHCMGQHTRQTAIGPMPAVQALVTAQGGKLVVCEDHGLVIAIEICQQPDACILLIDDNAATLHLWQRYLAQHNYRVVTAEDGLDAFRLAQLEKPSLIVLDVMMRGVDGWETLQRLKSAPSTQGIPVIVCSVLPERSLALSLGASEFLAKPVDRITFLQAIARCLDSSRGTQAGALSCHR